MDQLGIVMYDLIIYIRVCMYRGACLFGVNDYSYAYSI